MLAFSPFLLWPNLSLRLCVRKTSDRDLNLFDHSSDLALASRSAARLISEGLRLVVSFSSFA